jgi:flagellar FliL protein
MELELTDSATEEEITKKKAAIRDAVIVLLSSRSYKQIRETTGMVTLRRDILRAVNNLLTSGQVREVYFTQFHFN